MKCSTTSLLMLLAGTIVPATADDKAIHQHGSRPHEVIAPGKPIPGESLYQLKIDLTSQDNKPVALSALRGKPALLTMFYSSCDGVCPMIAFTLRRMESALTSAQRARLRVLMVSFDPERDTPQALKRFATDHKADSSRWLLARAPDAKVRELAAALGIRYRKLDGGTFSHSTVIALLDEDGVVRAHTSTLSELDPDFMRALKQTLDSAR